MASKLQCSTAVSPTATVVDAQMNSMLFDAPSSTLKSNFPTENIDADCTFLYEMKKYLVDPQCKNNNTYIHDQLVFLSSMNMWCTQSKEREHICNK